MYSRLSLLSRASNKSNLLTTPVRGFASVDPAVVGSKSAKLIETEEKYAAHNYHPLPVVFEQASGVFVKYVD